MKTLFTLISLLTLAAPVVPRAHAEDADNTAIIYNVYRGIYMGEGDIPPKDYYINAGTKQGLRIGGLVDVYRRVATQDNHNQRLAGELAVPIASLKIIAVDGSVAVARLERAAPITQTLSGLSSVMIGDVIRVR